MIRFYAFLATIGAVIAAAIGIFTTGKRQARANARLKELEQGRKAHERINKVDTGADLSDSERVRELERIAKQFRD